jgi:uncharacterized protein (DUF3084 family)
MKAIRLHWLLLNVVIGVVGGFLAWVASGQVAKYQLAYYQARADDATKDVRDAKLERDRALSELNSAQHAEWEARGETAKCRRDGIAELTEAQRAKDLTGQLQMCTTEVLSRRNSDALADQLRQLRAEQKSVNDELALRTGVVLFGDAPTNDDPHIRDLRSSRDALTSTINLLLTSHQCAGPPVALLGNAM